METCTRGQQTHPLLQSTLKGRKPCSLGQWTCPGGLWTCTWGLHTALCLVRWAVPHAVSHMLRSSPAPSSAPSLGAVSEVAAAGVIGTGTHNTGIGHGILPTQVRHESGACR